jgi:hypothetical protein
MGMWSAELAKVDDDVYIRRVRQHAERTGEDFWRLMVLTNPIREKHKEYRNTFTMNCLDADFEEKMN